MNHVTNLGCLNSSGSALTEATLYTGSALTEATLNTGTKTVPETSIETWAYQQA